MDNQTEATQKEAFSAGYEAGWKARGEYIRDYRNSLSGTSLGLGIMMIAGLMGLMFIMTSIFMPVVPERAVIAVLVSVGFFVLGWYINKKEDVSFKKKQAEFKDKWGE